MGIASGFVAATRVAAGFVSNRPLWRRRAAWLAAVAAASALSGFGARPSRAETGPPPCGPAGGSAPAEVRGDTPRVASRSAAPPANAHSAPDPSDPDEAARRAIADCQAAYAGVRDYTCTFVKRERIGGRLTTPHVMEMKARTKPLSIYFKFRSPNKGREAIYVAGKNGGKVTAHDVGIGKFLAGTMHLDPRGSMAMEDCLHPITEAGLGALIDTVAGHWNAELGRGEAKVAINPDMRIGNHPCTMIETTHPVKRPHLLYYRVRLYVSHENRLPIRFETYDWPARAGAPPEPIGEYTYLDVRLNVGLGEHDFDPRNRAYSFGRF